MFRTGGFVVAFSMFSLFVKEKLYINETVLGTAFGIIIGPHAAGIFDPRSWTSSTTASDKITLEVMRIVLATGLFAIGVELPQSYMARHVKGLLTMVVPTMAIGWITVAGKSSGLLRLLFPRIEMIPCLAIAACLTPTDPIISAAIVGGKFAVKHVPLNLRQIISAESAANDGLAYPFLTIALYLLADSTRKEAIGHWFLIGWLYQVILGVVLGAVLGLCVGFSYLMKFSHRQGYIDGSSYLAQYLALAFLTIGIASSLGTDDLLAAFAAGNAISWDGHFNIQTENEVFATVIDLMLNCACFVYIGAWLPFQSFRQPALGIDIWRLVVLFLAILILRRIPSVLLLYKWIPEIHTWREALFTGHFGPMGVGAIFISTLALHKLPEPNIPPVTQEDILALTLQPIVSFVVLCSILTHGLSIPFFSLSRNVSRTVSLSTFTSTRQPDGPDWLSWTRRNPVLPTNPKLDVEREAAVNTIQADAALSGPSTLSPPPTPRRTSSEVSFKTFILRNDADADGF
ncbi:Cation/H+ exchanger [Mycena floridula]|nr:Cation/H+ exchanger [Mycena floridula]